MLVESTVCPNKLEVTKYFVYVNTNIEQIIRPHEEDEGEDIIYRYEQEKYDKDEYIRKLLKRTDLLEDAVQDLILLLG